MLSAVDKASSSSLKRKEKMPRVLSDFDARYLGALDDFDELEDIEPGSLTLNNKGNLWMITFRDKVDLDDLDVIWLCV